MVWNDLCELKDCWKAPRSCPLRGVIKSFQLKGPLFNWHQVQPPCSSRSYSEAFSQTDKKSDWMHHFNVGQLTATCYSIFTAEGAQIITTSSNPLSLDMLRSTPLAASLCVPVTGLSFPHVNKLSGISWHVQGAKWN